MVPTFLYRYGHHVSDALTVARDSAGAEDASTTRRRSFDNIEFIWNSIHFSLITRRRQEERVSNYDERNEWMRRQFGEDGRDGADHQRRDVDLDEVWGAQSDRGSTGPAHDRFGEYAARETTSVWGAVTGILLQPTETFKKLAHGEYQLLTFGLIALICAHVMIDVSASELTLTGVRRGLATLAMGGLAFGIVAYALPWACSFALGLFGGAISDHEARTVAVWGMIPTLLLLVPSILFTVVESDGGFVFGLVEHATTFWSWALTALGLSALGNVSLLRAFFAQIVAWFIVGLPLFGFLILYVLLLFIF